MSKLEEWTLDGRGKVLACLLLGLASVLLYSPALEFDFTKYDDSTFISQHPQLYGNGTVGDRLKQIVYLDFPREEPLIVRDLTWLADSLVFGFNRPFGYHFGNVVYHALAMVFAFLLLLRIANPATAIISSSLLVVLAAHVEPVAWIMGRKDILSALFSILSIMIFLQLQRTTSIPRKLLVYGGSMLFALAALLSKVNAVVLPGVMFLCSLLQEQEFLRKGFGTPDWFRILLRRFVQVLPVLALAIVTYGWYISILADYGIFRVAMDYSTENFLRLLLIVNPLILLEYLKIVLVPHNLEAYYTEPSVFTIFSAGDVALAITVLAVTFASLVLLWRVQKESFLLLSCFLIAMLPYANWAHFGFWYANRYVYFASIFLVAGLVHVVLSLEARSKLVVAKYLVVLAVLVVFGKNLTYRTGYLEVWRNGETLWQSEIAMPGASLHDYNSLISYYIGRSEDSIGAERQQWLEKAQVIDREALKLTVPPSDLIWVPRSHYQKGLLLTYTGAPLENQLNAYLAAVEAAERYTLALRGVGSTYFKMALEETDQNERHSLAMQSMSFFQRSFESADNDSRARAYRQSVLDQFEKEFPELLKEEVDSEPRR